eukprot:552579-Heterocapsa_arctica.AAC.1
MEAAEMNWSTSLKYKCSDISKTIGTYSFKNGINRKAYCDHEFANDNRNYISSRSRAFWCYRGPLKLGSA